MKMKQGTTIPPPHSHHQRPRETEAGERATGAGVANFSLIHTQAVELQPGPACWCGWEERTGPPGPWPLPGSLCKFPRPELTSDQLRNSPVIDLPKQGVQRVRTVAPTPGRPLNNAELSRNLTKQQWNRPMPPSALVRIWWRVSSKGLCVGDSDPCLEM